MKQKKAMRPGINPVEQYMGHLVGPLGYAFLSYFLNGYLNVYYTDICALGNLWGGRFMSIYPIAVKTVSVLTFLAAGWLIDRTRSKWGKARPWLLISVPLIPISAFLLFLVPKGNETLTALAVMGSNFLFYAVAATLYATANTLMVPLSSDDPEIRSRLAVTANAKVMIAGTFSAMLMPMVLIPRLGVNQNSWILVAAVLSVLAAPLTFLQFAVTRERVQDSGKAETVSLSGQLKACLKSKRWRVLMLYFLLQHMVTALSNASVFYYCNWVLGTYQDGITQTIFYAVGNFPLGIGIFACNPICRKIGRRNAMCGGLLMAALGLVICCLFPKSLPLVLVGQLLKSCGTIPSTYLASLLLGSALDDVYEKSGQRCDGFSSSLFNAILTVTGGLAFSILNAGMAACGYLAPAVHQIPTQPDAVQGFFVFCQMGACALVFPVLAWMLWREKSL